MEMLGIKPNEENGQVQMADGTAARTLGKARLAMDIQGRTYVHDFWILPTLREAALIGIDLWSRLGLTISPPRQLRARHRQPTCGKTTGLTTSTQEEEERLKDFLKHELQKFQTVTGPTPMVEHHIRLNRTTPIKQRYRPRNPAMQTIIDAEVEEMEKAGVIEPSRSA